MCIIFLLVMESVGEVPFSELPEALVEEMLNGCGALGEDLSKSFKKLYKNKDKIRSELKKKGLLKKDTELSFAPSHPTSCGIDAPSGNKPVYAEPGCDPAHRSSTGACRAENEIRPGDGMTIAIGEMGPVASGRPFPC